MSSPRKILVTAATGPQGTGTVYHCLQAGHEVYALVRDPSTEKAKALQQQGAKLVKGDFDEPASLEVAMQGMTAVFLNLPVGTGLESAKNVIAAARASPTVSTMIASTVVKAGEHESFPRWGPEYSSYDYWLTKDAVERAVREAGFKTWTIVRPAWLLQNLLPPMRDIVYFPGFDKDRTLRMAYTPEAKIAWLDSRDVGVVAAAAVSQPEKYSGRHIELAGDALTIQEVADKLGKFIGETVKLHYYTAEELAALPNPRVTDSQIWTCEVPIHDATNATKEFNLTSMDKFLEEYKDLL